jgi:hypothetical protein
LKATEFRPEYAGKLNFYLNVVNAQLKHPQDRIGTGTGRAGRAGAIVRRALRMPLTCLVVPGAMKKENKIEARIKPSTNFGNLSEITPRPGRSLSVAGKTKDLILESADYFNIGGTHSFYNLKQII